MPLTIHRVGRSEEKPKLNAMIYGLAGTGKTTLCGQANDHADLAPVLFADVDRGVLSVSARGDVDAVAIRSTGDLDELFWDLFHKRNGFDVYRTVVIDSGTFLANRALEEWTARNQERAHKKNKRKDETADDVQLEDYGKMTAQVRRVMSWYRELDINLLVTALARFEYPKDADTKTSDPIAVAPDFTAKLMGNLTGMMDHVWYLYKNEDGSRSMLTEERGVFRAKTRGEKFAPALGFVVDNPWLPGIYDLLLETEAGGFAPQTAQDDAEGDDTTEET